MVIENSTDSDFGRSHNPKRNWWKAAFFVALLAFEVAREFAVIANASGAVPSTSASVDHYGSFTFAEGTWKRIDGGEPLEPGTVTINCDQELQRCDHAWVGIREKYVSAPELNWYNAKFEPESISYENLSAICVKYTIRIDLKLKKVFSVRERKLNTSEPRCNNLENRIEMQLSDGLGIEDKPQKGHFVPLIDLAAAFFGLF